MSDRLYKRGDVWWCWYYDPNGSRVRRSTRCRDQRAAEQVLRRLERIATAPDGDTTHVDHSVEEALTYMLASGLRDNAAGSAKFFEVKAGHVLRLLGDRNVPALTSDDLCGYVDTRVDDEGAARETVRKELSVLRKALTIAVARKLCAPGVVVLIPKVQSDYTPRTTHLTEEEFARLLAELTPRRQIWILLAVYLGMRRAEIEARTWDELTPDRTWIHARGTKTAGADRMLPVPLPLRRVLATIDNQKGRLVAPWSGVCWALMWACKRARVPRVTPNDLRRTFASWHVQRGTPLKVVAQLLGHSSTRMVDLVYGHVSDRHLAAAAATLPDVTGDRDNGVREKSGRGGKGGERGNPAPPDLPGNAGGVVPKGGIEPPTRGFSILNRRREKTTIRSVSARRKRAL